MLSFLLLIPHFFNNDVFLVTYMKCYLTSEVGGRAKLRYEWAGSTGVIQALQKAGVKQAVCEVLALCFTE